MSRRPFILITPCIQPQGYEFDDLSLSLSDCYARSIAKAGGIPFILSRETDPEIVSECVRRADCDREAARWNNSPSHRPAAERRGFAV